MAELTLGHECSEALADAGEYHDEAKASTTRNPTSLRLDPDETLTRPQGERMRLRTPSPDAWLAAVLADFDQFLLDHAACERKASGMAMHLAAHYRDRSVLVEAMVDLACEELDHFRQVYRIARDRGLALAADEKDAYVNAMNDLSRRGSEGYFLDRLLLAGIIEARGCERFGLIADALEDDGLKSFYQQITRSESRHSELFCELAREYFPATEVQERHAELLDAEAEIVARLPIRARLH